MPLAELEERKPSQSFDHSITFRLAKAEDAAAIVSVYENVFGVGGIKAPGHEQYPEPDVFTPEGVVRIAADPARRLVVAELDGRIVGGMIINFLSRYNCEFACVCVDRAFQGLGISPRMLAYARQLADDSSLTINSTEIVTHSVLSQTAHNGAGYDKVSAFGYCQYPYVFFVDHPESCLWITDIRGRVARQLLAYRAAAQQRSLPEAQLLSDEEQSLARLLAQPRPVFLSKQYEAIVADILSQFAELIDYRIEVVDTRSHNEVSAASSIKADFPQDAPYAYIKFPSRLQHGWQKDIDKALSEVAEKGRRYIQARIPANSPSAAAYAEYLRRKNFVLLGFLPLYSFDVDVAGGPHFDDLLVLQWIAPDIVQKNPLPGETDSVIKLYGYPANLTGRLLKVIRSELRQIKLSSGVRS